MAVVVQKYGGTSVGDPARIAAVADRVVATRSKGLDVVVVVSAMGQTTDQLLELASQVSSNPHPREMDMLLTAGERISMALLAMALNDRGVPAVSFTGSQAGILTDSAHGGARITRITGERVRSAIEEGKVVIVAGFQGVDPQSKEVTTLGRGGSDTTAVALAATLEAESCEILTDVDGLFTADPRLVAEAAKIDAIGYAQMQALAEAGAGVLMPQSVEFAAGQNVPVHIRSSFSTSDGTWVTDSAPELDYAGITARRGPDSGVVTIIGARAREAATDLMSMLDEAGLTTDLIEVTPLGVEMFVEIEEVDEAVRLIHGRLFEMKATT